MSIIFWLFLGFITYIIVRRSAATVTKTPVWLLWLVMMFPATTWTVWTMIYGAQRPMPILLAFVPFMICLPLYIYLIQRGRIPPRSSDQSAAEVGSTSPPKAENLEDGLGKVSPLAVLSPFSRDEEAQLQNCFPWSVFYVQNFEYRPQAVICQGHLRSSPEEAYKTIRQNVEAKFGDRFLLVFQEGMNGKPFFALVPNPYLQKTTQQITESLNRPGVAVTLLLISLLITTHFGAQLVGITPEQIRADQSLWLRGLPYALCLLAILGTREMVRYGVARFYQVPITPPYFIPLPVFPGVIGAFVQTRSPIPNRQILFDIYAAGPLASLLIALPIVIWGLFHSQIVPLNENPQFFDFNAFRPNFLLFALLAKMVFGAKLAAQTAIKLHPVAIAGFLGLLLTAVYLIPIGQLGGGRIVHAMVGQRLGALIGRVARILLLLLCLFVQPQLLLLGLILFVIPAIDEPTLNDVSELNNPRDLIGLFCLTVLLLILLPAPRWLFQ